MASVSPKSTTVLIPDAGNSEKSFCRLCPVNNIGHIELLHHNISAPHIKKLKAQVRLRSQCMLCPVYMLDIKAAEAHVQDPRHKRRLKHNFNPKVATNMDTRFRCCRLVFTCSIALELHLYMSHKLTFSKENLPDLSDIIFQLSGCSADASKVNLSPECVLCEVKCQAMDGFVMHMFSNMHMKSLRTSTCLVCELKFIHVDDRERHLLARKHKSHLQKVCLSNRIKKLKDMGQGEYTRYVCMYCMIWCKSWPCFVLHLLGSAHRLCTKNQDHQHINSAVYAQLQAEKIVETIQDAPISTISGRNCKSWLDQPSGLSAWCLVCEEMICSPEMLEKHLEGHPQGLQSMHMKKRNSWIEFFCREAKGCEFFECDVCYIIFKNDFSLTTHKAFQQHHIQQANVLNGGVLCRCYDCRIRSKSTTAEKKLPPKPNSMIFEGCKSEENVTTFQNHNVKDINTEANKESSHDTSGSAKTQEKTNIVTENIMPVSRVGNSSMTVVEQSPDNGKFSASVSQSTEEPMNEAFKSLSNSIQQENIKSEFNVENDKVVSQIFDTHDNPEAHYDGAIDGTSGSGNKDEIHADCQTNEQTETHFNQKSKEETLQQPSGCEEFIFQEMMPVVIAAAIPPCDSIHNSVQSAMKLVKECLTKAVPKIRKSSSELFSSNKRHKENDLYEHEFSCLRPILESAVCEGLQSFISHSALGEYKHGPGGTSISICTEDVEGVSVAFATTVIPPSSTTQLDTPLLIGDDRENGSKETYDAVEKIHGVRNVLQETDINVLDDEKLSIDKYTQQLNVVFEEDSSSDSDDHRVYLSSTESESSQDYC